MKSTSERLKEAKFEFEEGKKSGRYVFPSETEHWNWRAGERYNRQASYIAELEEKVAEENPEANKKAKEIFDKYYMDQLDKNLYPHYEAKKLALKEINEEIRNYNCLCQWRMDYLIDIKNLLLKK